jgi:hypothetical protein
MRKKIDRKIEDPTVEKLKSIISFQDTSPLETLAKLNQYKMEENEELLSMQEAYDYLRANGYDISFRAFSGRVERGLIPTTKIGRKRYIPKAFLDRMLEISSKAYNVKDAYEKLRRYYPELSLRALIGRLEKGSIPSVKIGGRRYIPKDVVEGLIHLAKNYYSVAQAYALLKKKGIKIKRNAFERRLDRNAIPHVKIGGRRYIPKDVVEEIIRKELGY